jgi:hypothetical protein
MSGGIWIASYVLLWVAVVVLGLTVIALLRQVGVLHTRVAPMGVHFAGEGPDLDSSAPHADRFGYERRDLTLLAFTSPTCELCASLVPGLRKIEQSYDELQLQTVSSADDSAVFAAFKVRSTPYLVAIDRAGIVRSRGVANTLDQAEEMLAEVLASGTTSPTPPGRRRGATDS